MFSRSTKGEIKLILGLVLFGFFTVLSAVFISRMISNGVLERDASALASRWAQYVSNGRARPAPTAPGQTSNADDSNQTMQNVENWPLRTQIGGASMAGSAPLAAAPSPKLSSTQDRREGAPIGSPYEPYDSDEIFSFGSGEHFSIIHRFALLGSDRSVKVKGPRYNLQELGTLVRDVSFDRAFQKVINSGKGELLYASSGQPQLPERTARVFIPIKTGGRVSDVMIVDTDQSRAFTMFSRAFDVVLMATSALLLLGISAPVFVVWNRIQQHGRMKEEISFLAAHDPLTGLSNRTRFVKHLDNALEAAKRQGTSIAVLTADLDHLKDVNDTLGHSTGDELLAAVGKRIQKLVADNDICAGRVGGDAFSIIVEGPGARNAILILAHKLRETMAEPFSLEQHKLTISISAGMAVGPDDGDNPSTLLNHADIALEVAKASGDNGSCLYVPSMEEAAKKRRELETELREAIARDEFILEYQPQFDLRTGRVVGYEALVRWEHPKKGRISPDEFVPCAEQSGLIHAIGEWALRTGCGYAATWTEPVNIAINLSPVQFMNTDLIAMLKRILDETGLDPKRLEIEITESLLLHNIERVQHTLSELGELGVAVALDDFGTGYSSLSYLARFSFNKIKIDKSFVNDLGSSREASAVIKTIIGLGKVLDITIIAEGIETEAQAEALRAAGCNLVQGFLYGRPSEKVLDAWDATVKVARSMRKVTDAA